MASSNLQLQLLISTAGGKQSVAELLAVKAAADEVGNETIGITKLANSLGITYEAAQKLSKGFDGNHETIREAASLMGEMTRAGVGTEQQLTALASKYGLTAEKAKELQAAVNKESGGGALDGLKKLGSGVSAVAFGYNNVVQAAQNLKATLMPIYENLILSNEKLNSQLLESQTNLASSTRISTGGVEITDPTEKINATRPALKAALKQIEVDTQSLVGVTSAQVNQLFQTTLTNAASINNQSKKFPDAISAATSLTKGWAASLKVLNIPLQQADQEINSILRGTVDSNSQLAKNLGINNQQVNQWKAQGVLVDQLNKRLDVFVAGNAIAARSIDGISSNIQDLFERITRTAGEPLLEPIIEALAQIETFLKANEAAISLFLGRLVDLGMETGFSLFESFKPFGESLLKIGGNLGPIVISTIETLSTVLTSLGAVIGPIAGILGKIAEVVTGVLSSQLGQIAVQAGLVTVALVPMAQGIAGIGGALTVLQLKTIPAAITSLTALSATIIPMLPLLATLAAAAAVTFLIKGAKDLENMQTEIDGLRMSTDFLSDQTLRYSQKLKALTDIEAKGGTLTEAQIDQKRRLLKASGANLAGVNSQIDALKKLKPVDDAHANDVASQIEQLETLSKSLQKNSGGIVIQGRELKTLGTTREQYSQRSKEFLQQIQSEGGGQDEIFKKAAEGLVDVAQQQVKLGQITADEAANQLNAVKNNTKVEVETQQKAAEAIKSIYADRIKKISELTESGRLDGSAATRELESIKNNTKLEFETRKAAGDQLLKMKKEQNDAEVAQIQASIAEIDAARADGRVGEANAAAATSQLKEQEVRKRIEQAQAEADAATNPAQREKLLAEVRKQEAELTKIQAAERDRRNKERLKDFDEALTQAEAAFNKGQISEGEYNKQKTNLTVGQADEEIRQKQEAMGRLEGADKEGREAINAEIAKAESKKAKAIQDGQLKEIELIKKAAQKKITALEDAEIEAQERIQTLRNQGKISQEQADADLLQSSLSRIQQEIDAEKTKQKELGATSPEEAQKADDSLKDLGFSAAEVDPGAAPGDDNKVDETRQQEIRASRKRTAELSKQLQQQQLQDVERQVTKATALITEAEKGRQNELLRLQADGAIRTENVETQKLDSTRTRIQAELALEETRLSKLEKIPASSDPKQEETRQNQIRESKKRTADLTGSLIENEIQQQDQLRKLTIQALDNEVAAYNRSADAQLQSINNATQARQRAATVASMASDKEIKANEASTKSLERQSNLLKAKAALQDAQNAAAQTGTEIEINKIDAQLQASGGKDANLLQQKAALEAQLAAQKRSALTFEQEQARLQLTLDQQRNALAASRAVTEAKINELKAKQAILTAQAALQETRITDQKRIQEAQAALSKAKALDPGAERDRAIADAAAGLGTATNQATENQANAQLGISLAQQQAEFAKDGTAEAIAQQAAQTQINALQTQTLAVQQASALAQFNATEAAQQQAAALERGKAAAEGIAAANGAAASPQQAQSIPARKDGGPIGGDTPFIGAEEGPEVVAHADGGYSYLPKPGLYTVDRPGNVLTARQTAALLSPPPLPFVRSATASATGGAGAEAIVNEIKGLRKDVADRPILSEVNNTFTSPASSDYDQWLELQRSLTRGQL